MTANAYVCGARVNDLKTNDMEISKEQIKAGLDEAFEKAGNNAYFGNGFNAGVEFAQEQINSSNDIHNVIDILKSEQFSLIEEREKHPIGNGHDGVRSQISEEINAFDKVIRVISRSR